MTAASVLTRLKHTLPTAAVLRSRRLLLLALAAGCVTGGVLFWRTHRAVPMITETPVLFPVTVRTLAALAAEATVDKVVVIEPAVHAPLVARSTGVVTAVLVPLGEQTVAGEAVVQIDGSKVPSPARASLAAVQSALRVFAALEREAVHSAELAAATARAARDAAVSGRQLSRESVDVARRQADLQVRSAELALRDAQESDQRNDTLVRVADIALKAAGLAQDQAEAARRTAYQQTNDAVTQAQLAAAAAEQAVQRVRVDLQSQRASLDGQAAAAQAQVAAQQVVAPVSGEVTRLAVRVGDFVQPGAIVGEVTAAAGAQVELAVSTGVRSALSVGQTVALSTERQQFMGTIARLADAPSAETALWQVDIFITETPEVIHPGDLATVHLPAARPGGGTVFVPLDAVVIRQAGAEIFTVDDEDVVHSHVVTVAGYAGSFVEILTDLPAEARVVVAGNRQLRDGLKVALQP
ncbi:MAG: hypothetical protein COT71_00490 [Candidatus Andersenbacteria bacterium CG10_big_fil_rev_8_21_14_0_10_54_11]|uniref:RND efflux pump membrane fusion protein barrel-sandwich domain-containing protein n=1 Tax=Candidatus Andersenbacteria bacterium CG10_big_fil_rev_8_21_14_0_10_54_11 TaxID=1974485 RepID=A0A2M6X0E6_9BACT|nr:MAG: hypothetical protein COT71_00490 [Candidatus Andersenbacteria bacterium CG10_big_fil_rev_8_21_14_0_10_54_11]